MRRGGGTGTGGLPVCVIPVVAACALFMVMMVAMRATPRQSAVLSGDEQLRHTSHAAEAGQLFAPAEAAAEAGFVLTDTACAAGMRVEPGSCLANTHGELLSSRLSRLQKSGYRSSGSSGSGCEQQPWQVPSEAEVAAFEAKGRHFLQSRAFLQYPLQVRGIAQCAAVSISSSSNIIDKEVTPVPNYSCLTLIQRHVTLLAALASRLTADGRPASRQHWHTHVTASCTAMVLARCDALLCSSCGPHPHATTTPDSHTSSKRTRRSCHRSGLLTLTWPSILLVMFGPLIRHRNPLTLPSVTIPSSRYEEPPRVVPCKQTQGFW